MSQEMIDSKVKLIIEDKKRGKVIKRILLLESYFDQFLSGKMLEVNPNTNKTIAPATIRDYRTAFGYIKGLQLDDISKKNYEGLITKMMTTKSVNYCGKVIRKLKTFFIGLITTICQ